MCDYSLHVVPNRPAVEGERLVTHRFSTRAMGFVSPRGLEGSKPAEARQDWLAALKSALRLPPPPGVDVPAVCIPAGARLILRNIPERLQRRLRVGPTEKALFVELHASAYSYVYASAYTNRNAIRFRSGKEIVLQGLPEGLEVDVLSLGGSEAAFEHERATTPNDPPFARPAA